MRSTPHPLTALALAVVLAPARPVFAQSKEQAARKLDSDAMSNDYLATEFPRAAKKLQKALSLCGKSGCAASTVALLHRDLGVVLFLGLGKIDEGKAELAKAIAADPSVALDADLATPELRRIFKELKGGKGSKQGSSKAPDLDHTPVTEQAVQMPIPIYAAAGPALSEAKLSVRYKGVGASKWTGVPMKPHGDGFAAEIPCGAAPRPGEVVYYVQATDESGSVIATSGTRETPYRVTISKTVDEPPHLPDGKPPARCEADRPGEQEEPRKETATAAPEERRNWLTLSIEQDVSLILDNTTGVCTEANQVNGPYSCFRSAGTQYHGTPVANRFDSLSGGPALATTRVHLGYDRLLFGGVTAGVRLGVVIRGQGPTPEGSNVNPTPIEHLEARVAYWLGQNVFSTAGFRPFAFVAGGLAQVDTELTIGVIENRKVAPSASQLQNPSSQLLDTYRHMGQVFAGGGAGVRYAFTPGSGVVLDLKVMELFPTTGTVLAPELGFALGF